MRTRSILGLALLALMCCGLFVACSDIAGTDRTPEQNKLTAVAVGPRAPYQPIPYNQLTFTMDETAPAFNTLADYPNVVTWRLKANANIPNNAVINGNMNQLKTTVTIFGYNSRGNQIASGAVHIANPNNLNTWYCTVAVDGASLDMAQTADLVEDIVADIELGGDGTFGKTPCWVLGLKAAGGLAGSIGGGALVLSACFGSGGTACAPAVVAYLAAEGEFVEWIADWFCQCASPGHPLCEGY